jgi:hypothetical protein
MAKFEEMGGGLDRELERLREIAEKPATRPKAAKALRNIWGGLERLAEELESKSASKGQ